MPITEAELNDIEARANAATPGPWQDRFIYRIFESARRDPINLFGTEPAKDWPDSAFIAHARADVPKLIAAIRELQSQLNSKPQRRSKKQLIEEELRRSDLTAQTTGRTDIEYGHHDSLPRGEHVSRLKK